MRKSIYLIVLSLFIMSSCSKDDEITETGNIQIIFGNVYGACAEGCSDLYQLTDSTLFKNKTDIMNGIVLFDDTPLSDSKHNIATELLDLPKTLRNKTYESEDLIQSIADFDYYLEVIINGTESLLIFDEIDESKNKDLYEYAELMKQVMADLQ